MKRKYAIFGTILAAGTLWSAMLLNASAAQITEATAKSTALASVGLSADSVSFTKAKLDRDDGKLIYEIEFLTNDLKEYEFDIDAENGTILNMDYEWKAAPTSGSNAQAAITLEQAKTIAITHTGLSADQVTLKKAELDYDDGRLIYDIEFFTSDLRELEYEIDAVTGTIIQWGFDMKNYVPPVTVQPSTPAPGTGSNVSKPSSGLSLEEAKSKALSLAGVGSSNVRWKKAKLDHDDGRQIYELEFYYGNLEYEIEIDVATGAVLDFDVDEDD